MRHEMIRAAAGSRHLRPPVAANSEDERLQVCNEDLRDLSPSQLGFEIWRAATIAERFVGHLIFRGPSFITVRQWADERTVLCQALLVARRDTWMP